MLPYNRGQRNQQGGDCEEEPLDPRHVLHLLHVQPLLHEKDQEVSCRPVSQHEQSREMSRLM